MTPALKPFKVEFTLLLLYSILQLAYVILLAPLIAGILAKTEERLESKQGPSIFQPYFDLFKLLKKESLVPQAASPLFRIGPYINFAFYMLLIIILPILTGFPLTFGPTADFIGGGLIFGAASLIKKITALDSRNNYSHLGTARAASVGALAEPMVVLIFILCGIISNTNNPYVINNIFQTSDSWFFSIVHLFIASAFGLIIIIETGKLPIESKTQAEFGMIDQAMELEYSGPELAIYKWGSYIKHFLLMSVFLNVFAFPFWVPMEGASFVSVLIYSLIHFVKMVILTIIFALLEESISKYRLYKIFDYLAVAFVITILGVIAIYTTKGIF